MDKPKRLPDTTDWADETIAWFEAWRDSSLTDGWDAVRWSYFFDTAFIHTYAYQTGMLNALSEVGKREEKMGLTFDKPAVQAKILEVQVNPLVEAQRNRAARKAGASDPNRAAKAV